MADTLEMTNPAREDRGAAGMRPSETTRTPVRRALKDALTGEPWRYFAGPFPHIVAKNVFVPAVQAELEAAYEAVGREEGLGWVRPDFTGFTITAFGDRHKPLFPQFLCPEWLQMLARVCGVPVTPDIDGGLHHHTIGSSTGWVHNDNNPGWFEPRDDGDVNFCDRSRWDYKTGKILVPGAQPVMRVRAISMIYFLGNGDWQEGDGGETGLYEHGRQPVLQPSKRIPPLDNSILLFAVAPHSWHSFLTNVRKPRRSVIMFLHQESEVFGTKWGRQSLVKWS